jgi:flavin reductase (DIM6/NTAB) family NADH-FMN oxidoreductase RutF
MTRVADPADPADAAMFRAVMGGFATGVSIITTTTPDGERHGMTANSLTSVSLAPPLLLICLTRGTRTADAVAQRGAFVVNILREQQDSLSNRFARPGEDHFAGVATIEHDGLPILKGTLGYVVCRVDAVHPAGDHEIVLGAVEAVSLERGSPLVFYRGRYDTITGAGRDAELSWYF